MPRPEAPISGTGPVADLARELRRLRGRAGNPTYRELGRKASYGRTILAAAATGRVLPTWEVICGFAGACDASKADLDRLRELWANARDSERLSHARESRSWRAQMIAEEAGNGTRTRRRQRPPSRPPAGPAGRPQPAPDGNAAQFVRQLRALRAWAGVPPTGLADGVPRSTLYDALSPTRTRLPSLPVTQAIVASYAPDAIDEWTAAWRTIRLREFEEDNPLPQA